MITDVETSIIRAITNDLKTLCPNVFFGKSQVIYPKINCDLRQTGEDVMSVRYRLVFDYYTDTSSPPELITRSEQVRLLFNGAQYFDINGSLIVIQKDSGGGFIEEKDNDKIVHYEDAYHVTFYKSQEI